METFIARFYAVLLLVTGVSHLVQPRRWADFFIELKRHETSAFLIGVLTLPLGLLIVLGHNVWVFDVPVLVTIFGWMMTLKSIAYLVYPASFKAVSPDRHETFHRGFRWIGAAMTVLGAVLVYDGFFR